ncbi:serine/threonine protein phosphatase 1 [Rhizobium sp. RU35A]|nr:serine/threonine protein phosphatase 1 [Rhizobium sp. RU35A]
MTSLKQLLDWLRGKRVHASPLASRQRLDLGEQPPAYAIYAIGDIHGCIRELIEAEHRIMSDIEASGVPGLVVLLGDYIDRGPDSAAVLNHLSRPSPQGLRRLALCGNHDEMFLRFLTDPRNAATWLEFGGRETLMSYGVNIELFQKRDRIDFTALRQLLDEAIPLSHIDFIRKMPSSLKLGSYVFTHAGIRPGIPLEEQTDEDLLWIREPFLSRGPELPLTVVHGHTPVPEPEFKPGRIAIDTCAYATGRLCVLKIYQEDAVLL